MKLNKTILIIAILVLLLINTINPISYGYEEETIVKTHELSEDDIKKFVGNIVPKQLENDNIAGATISIVKDGKILFAKGYGYSDESQKLKVDSDTMFRIGSVTKLFTWTAIMQLVEQEKINLDDDIRKYIKDIKIGNNYEEPIRIKHLMTHTAGIEDRLSTLFMSKDGEVPLLKEALLKDERSRIFEPGEIIAYSNYGTGIAGLIIENVSGITYEDYIYSNILKPLKMNRTTLKQPASEYYENVSKGHRHTKTGYRVFEDPFTRLPPIGAISTSAEDMSKFAIMHLQNGMYKDKILLKENTSKLMQKTQFTSDDRLPGICLGFMEWKRNGKRIIWHSGGTSLFNTLFMLIPEENVGVFISYNSPNSGEARSEFRQKFLDRYYPYNNQQVSPVENYKERVGRFEGTFKEGRTAKFNSDKLMFALSRAKEAVANSDGTLEFRGTKYIEVEPLIFNEVNGQGKLIFKEDENGKVKYAFQDFEPHEAYIKIKWYENPKLNMSIFIVCISIFLITIIMSIIKNLTNILLKKNKENNDIRKIEKLIILTCIFHLLFPIGSFLGIWIEILLNPRVITTGSIPLLFKIALIFPPIGGLLTIVTIPHIMKAWKNKSLRLGSRVHYTLVTIISAIFILWMHNWNLLGYFR